MVELYENTQQTMASVFSRIKRLKLQARKSGSIEINTTKATKIEEKREKPTKRVQKMMFKMVLTRLQPNPICLSVGFSRL